MKARVEKLPFQYADAGLAGHADQLLTCMVPSCVCLQYLGKTARNGAARRFNLASRIDFTKLEVSIADCGRPCSVTEQLYGPVTAALMDPDMLVVSCSWGPCSDTARYISCLSIPRLPETICWLQSCGTSPTL